MGGRTYKGRETESKTADGASVSFETVNPLKAGKEFAPTRPLGIPIASLGVDKDVYLTILAVA